MFNRRILFSVFFLFTFSMSNYASEKSISAPQERVPSKDEAILILTTYAQYEHINEKNLDSSEAFNESIYLAKILTSSRNQIEKQFNELHTNYEIYKKTLVKKLIPFTLQKMTLLAEALYLISTTKDDITKNKDLAKSLGLKYHPDKTKDEQEQKFFTNILPPLLNNTTNIRLSDLINDTYEKTIDIIKKPSIAKTTSSLATNLALCPSAQVIGYKMIANLLPNKPVENHYYQECIKETQKGALLIETELLRYPNKR